MRLVLRFLEALGGFVLRRFESFGTIVLLYAETMRQLTHRPRMRHILAQMSHLGVDSLAIVCLTLLFTGVVLTLQMAHEFIKYGAQRGPCSSASSARAASGLPSRRRFRR